MNTGSVPLSTQELRQVLNKGPFADWLMEITNKVQPIHKVLRLEEPDPRLKDVEIIFRFIAITLFGEKYRGSLKRFLDSSMSDITNEWKDYKAKVIDAYAQFNSSLELLQKILNANHIGRKFTNGKWDHIFNKVLFEVEAYYFMFVSNDVAKKKSNFVEAFKDFCSNDTSFRRTIEVGTNASESYYERFRSFRNFVNKVFGTNLKNNPIPKPVPSK